MMDGKEAARRLLQPTCPDSLFRGHGWSITGREEWRPVRYVHIEQTCYSCWRIIPKQAPGSTKGTRGTKAYYQPEARLWQCMECAQERERAETAREDAL